MARTLEQVEAKLYDNVVIISQDFRNLAGNPSRGKVSVSGQAVTWVNGFLLTS
jgi:hypothetical protein